MSDPATTNRWAELELARLGSHCSSSLPSAQIRVEQWQSAKTPQPSYAHPARGSAFAGYLIFSESEGGIEMFVPRDSTSGLRTVACPAGAGKCLAAARDGSLLVKWSTTRGRLAAGLEQDWACIRNTLDMARTE